MARVEEIFTKIPNFYPEKGGNASSFSIAKTGHPGLF
jgi:hypothetical protein